ncbi:hypothetical protein AAG593_07910 [Citromicrobium bathyomarinum]
MRDDEFDAIRAEIDKEIDALPDSPSGVKMGFDLAGAFLVRGLLETVTADMVLWQWEMRAYRGRYVYPDPMMGEREYSVGKPNEG